MHPFFQAQQRPFVVAHRGGGGLAPENTLAAFANTARIDPAAIIEFDVHRTADGQLVVIHDDTVDRTTEGRGPVASRSLAGLQALDAGFCFSPGSPEGTAEPHDCSENRGDFTERARGHVVPTLARVLEELPRTKFISIEVKAAHIEAEVAAMLRDKGWADDHVVVGSFDDDIARRLRHHLPGAAHYAPLGTAACVALPAVTGNRWPTCPGADVTALPTSVDFESLIRQAQDRGSMVVFFTPNEPEEIRRLLRAGADGLITDFPDRARTVINQLRAAGELP